RHAISARLATSTDPNIVSRAYPRTPDGLRARGPSTMEPGGRLRPGLAGREALPAVVGEHHLGVLPAHLGGVVDGELGRTARLRAGSAGSSRPAGRGQMARAGSLHASVLLHAHSTH